MDRHRFLCAKNSSHIHVHFCNKESSHTYDINDEKLVSPSFSDLKRYYVPSRYLSPEFRRSLEFLSIFCMINDGDGDDDDDEEGDEDEDEDSPDKKHLEEHQG
eukprot:jgi/Psemu1/37332/gm1.37332_g